jgi:ubiquinone/menaquinone biosynthesis C-methylase UbiE
VSFDSVARIYHSLEAATFGRALQRARTAFINRLKEPRRALLLGEGNGRFLCELLRVHPRVEILCVDQSEGMLALARKALQKTDCKTHASVQFEQQDLRTWSPPAGQFDLIVTHFFLDCFGQTALERIVMKLCEAATPHCMWLIADFQLPARGLSRWHAHVWLAAMYLFFRLAAAIEARNLIDPAPFLRRSGWQCEAQQIFRFGMLKSELWRRDLAS